MNAREKYVRQWLEKTDEDRQAMERLMEGNPILEMACFHAQQCVEKALKGFLTVHDRHLEKTHDLTDILELCVEVNSTFAQFEQTCKDLTPFAVDARYPGPKNPDTIEEARRLVEAADHIYQFTREVLDLDS